MKVSNIRLHTSFLLPVRHVKSVLNKTYLIMDFNCWARKRINFHVGQHIELFLLLLTAQIYFVKILPSKIAAYINRKGLYGRLNPSD